MTEATTLSDISQLVSFRLGNEEYGSEIMQVREIIRIQEITPVPETPEFVEGVINLRGSVIPIIDLRKRFGMEQGSRDKDTRIVVVSVEGREVGIIVDAVAEVLRITSDQVEQAPAVVSGIGKEYLLGVAKLEDRLLIILDLNKVLSAEELGFLDEVMDGEKIENE